jgi:hypothetical protein
MKGCEGELGGFHWPALLAAACAQGECCISVWLVRGAFGGWGEAGEGKASGGATGRGER